MHKPRNGVSGGSGRYADVPELADAVGRFGGASLLVVGDAMLDRYVHGQLAQPSADAPVPVLAVERELALPGGAANLVRNLTALGASVSFVSVVGDDQTGSDLTGLIGGQPGVEPWLLVQGGRATTLRTRYVAEGRPVLRADQEDTGPIQAKLAERLLRIARDAMVPTTTTVLADYGKGVLSEDTPAQLVAAARQSHRPVIAIPHGADYARYAGADVLVIGGRELAQNVDLALPADADAALAADDLRQRHGFTAVMMLRGDDGMILAAPDGTSHFAVDRTELAAAGPLGDAIIATLAAGMAAGLGIRAAAELASFGATLVASRPGSAVAAIDGDVLPIFDSWRGFKGLRAAEIRHFFAGR